MPSANAPFPGLGLLPTFSQWRADALPARTVRER